jgi:transcriptional regulator with PAS, ATPase and Fis domain
MLAQRGKTMSDWNFIEGTPFYVIVCDSQGIILAMNAKAVDAFANDGGKKLIGSNLFGCHSEESQKMLREMIQTRRNNIYTVEKKGKKKLIIQTPWYENGQLGGLMEMGIEISGEIPHIVRE